ncbi:hypothetical protein [Photobacterium ganghwense]|nr:hypothetical protein [Photobacterium ganghwense]QSV17498.1 hypothetical protein FH974_17130 [Photobacterium ganghwense]
MKSKRFLAALLAAAALLAGCSDDEVGDVSLGMFTLKDKPMFTNTITQQF